MRAWVALFGLACSGQDSASFAPPPEPEVLDPTTYDLVDAADDPLASHRPDPVDCSSVAFRVETGQLEINTERCNYAMVAFEALQDVPAGTPIRATVFHTGLWAEEPATAHIAWHFNGTVQWEAEPPIPENTAFYLWEGSLPAPLRAGDPVYFHLHNHGVNDWTVSEFVRLDADGAE